MRECCLFPFCQIHNFFLCKHTPKPCFCWMSLPFFVFIYQFSPPACVIPQNLVAFQCFFLPGFPIGYCWAHHPQSSPKGFTRFPICIQFLDQHLRLMITAISDCPTLLTIAHPQFQRFLFSYWFLAFQPFQNYILDFAPFGSVRSSQCWLPSCSLFPWTVYSTLDFVACFYHPVLFNYTLEHVIGNQRARVMPFIFFMLSEPSTVFYILFHLNACWLNAFHLTEHSCNILILIVTQY